MEKEIQETLEKGYKDINEKIDNLSAENTELKEKVKTLEERPIVSKGANILIPETYKGRRLSRQLEKFRGKMRNPEMADHISKAVIDMIDSKGQIPLQKAAAVQVEGTDAKGGYLVLDAFDDIITQYARDNSVMVPLVNNKSVAQTDTFKFNTQDQSVVLTWDAEGTVTATSATYAQSTINIKRLSGYVSVSNELLQDDVYDIVGDITEQFGYALGQELDNQILNGTGDPVSGLLTAAAGNSIVMAMTGSEAFSSVQADEYSSAIVQLSTNDSTRATFVLGKIAAHYVRTLKDDNSGPIYQAIAGPNLDTIYGTPRVVSAKISDTSAADTAFAVLGDWSMFYLINRLGNLELLVDPYSDSVSYNTRFIWATRKGLGIRRSSAFCRIMTGA